MPFNRFCGPSHRQGPPGCRASRHVASPRATVCLGATPFGNAGGPLSRRDTTTIAQRFNAGTGQFCVAPVPKGRLNPSSAGRVPSRPGLGRPFGTWGLMTAKLSVETLGYSRMSLRDSDRRAGQGNCRKARALRRHLQKEPIQPIQPMEHLPFRPLHAKISCAWMQHNLQDPELSA